MEIINVNVYFIKTDALITGSTKQQNKAMQVPILFSFNKLAQLSGTVLSRKITSLSEGGPSLSWIFLFEYLFAWLFLLSLDVDHTSNEV